MPTTDIALSGNLRLLVHSGYHKCLTVYFHRVLGKLSRRTGWPLHNTDSGPVPENPEGILLDPQSRLDLSGLPDFRGTHVIRDPRDLLISAYHYHLRTTEEWCVKPNPANIGLPADRSYQEHLRSLDQESGLAYEMTQVTGGIIERMAKWNYEDPRFLELRYEDIMGNERATFERIFDWYGIDPEQAAWGADQAESLALRPPGRWPGLRNLLLRKHVSRDRRIGKWADYLSDHLKAQFKDRYGEHLIRLGYESGLDW